MPFPHFLYPISHFFVPGFNANANLYSHVIVLTGYVTLPEFYNLIGAFTFLRATILLAQEIAPDPLPFACRGRGLGTRLQNFLYHVAPGIYGRACDSVCKKRCTRTSRSQNSLRDSIYSLAGSTAACNLALKRDERPCVCGRKKEYFQWNWTRIPACLSREVYFFLN